MVPTPTFGSLFAGIGGLDLGMERAGWRALWQAETDPTCRAVLAARFPHAQLHGDVRTLGPATPRPDALVGGFPCQDVSDIGKGAGLDRANRSGLWHEFHRLIRLLRPRVVVVENVPGLRRRGLGTVLGDLAASGFDAEWTSFRAADVGAPHRRERLWLVAYPAGADEGPRVGDAGRRVLVQGRGPTAGERPGWPAPSGVPGVAHGIPHGLDRRAALGNAVVPAAAEVIARAVLEAIGRGAI